MAAEHDNNDAKIQQLALQPVVSIRSTILIANLGEAMGERLQALSGYLQQSGARPVGPPFVRYHTFGATEADLETGIPVVDPIVGEGRIAVSELPAGPAVTTWHFGSHDTLGEAYARIHSLIQEGGHEPNGAAWEVYYWIDPNDSGAPSTFPDPSTWRTQLIQPIK